MASSTGTLRRSFVEFGVEKPVPIISPDCGVLLGCCCVPLNSLFMVGVVVGSGLGLVFIFIMPVICFKCLSMCQPLLTFPWDRCVTTLFTVLRLLDRVSFAMVVGVSIPLHTNCCFSSTERRPVTVGASQARKDDRLVRSLRLFSSHSR